MSKKDADAMRLMLAQEGIFLDPPIEPKAARSTATAASALEPDRVSIRAILIERGAREKDLDWLTASCPNLDFARAYAPPVGARPIEGETYEDNRDRWFVVDEVNANDPNGREVLGRLMNDGGSGIAKKYSCTLDTFGKIWRQR